MKKDKTLIVYFSGTGSTKRVAETFRELFDARAIYAEVYPLDLSVQNAPTTEWDDVIRDTKLLLVVYAVHAFDAPVPIYDWIEDLPFGNEIPTVVIAVSGGGNIWPNTLCRASCIKALEEKGYEVFYEEMLVMPSNFMIKTNDDLSMWLLKTIPVKAGRIIDDAIAGKRHRTGFVFGGKFIRSISRMEKNWAELFGLALMVSGSCDGCGWCAENCPRNNIEVVDGRPVFSNQCMICMRCVYGCSLKAIYSDRYQYCILKDGYSLEMIEEKMKGKELKSVEKCSKGLLWLGVKRYLLDGH